MVVLIDGDASMNSNPWEREAIAKKTFNTLALTTNTTYVTELETMKT